MQFLAAAPLVDKFRSDTFRPEEVGSYFMAHMIFMAVFSASTFGIFDLLTNIISVGITIGGVLFLKKQNGGTFSNNFLSKYFCLGWIISVRLFLLALLAGSTFSWIGSALGMDGEFTYLVLTFGLELTFYLGLGWLFGECN